MTSEHPIPETTDSAAGAEPAHPRRSQRVVVLALALVAVLAVGFGLGATLGLPSGGDNLSVPAADSVDVGFAQDMTVHHQQGVQMATVAYNGAVDPYVRNLAFDIMTSQLAQVGQMQGWLSLWGRSLAPSGAYMTWMSDAAGHHGGGSGHSSAGMAAMPGMASAAEIAQLRATTGPELDTLFLQLMLRHHQGGAEMLSYAADRAVEPVVRNLAKQASTTQQSESSYMSDLLAQRGAAPLPLGG